MKIHIVKEGDTLYKIAKLQNIELNTLIAANPQISNPNKLDIGTQIKVPTKPGADDANTGQSIAHKHQVMQGDSLWKLSKKWGVPLKALIYANPQLKNPNFLKPGETVNIPTMDAVQMQATQMQATQMQATQMQATQMQATQNVAPTKLNTAKKDSGIIAPAPVEQKPEKISNESAPNIPIENVKPPEIKQPIQTMKTTEVVQKTENLFIQLEVPANEVAAPQPVSKASNVLPAVKENKTPNVQPNVLPEYIAPQTMEHKAPKMTAYSTPNIWPNVPFEAMNTSPNLKPHATANQPQNVVYPLMPLSVHTPAPMPNAMPYGMPPNAEFNTISNAMPNSMPNVMPYGMPNAEFNTMPNSMLNSMPNSMPYGMPNAEFNTMSYGMPNAMPYGISMANQHYGYPVMPMQANMMPNFTQKDCGCGHGNEQFTQQKREAGEEAEVSAVGEESQEQVAIIKNSEQRRNPRKGKSLKSNRRTRHIQNYSFKDKNKSSSPWINLY